MASFIRTCACLALLFAVFTASAEPSQEVAPPAPNILFIYIDDLGYEALNCYGGLDFSTPELDRMAAEGVRFSRAYASGVCTPSRVSMHTGLYSSRHQETGVLPVHLGTDRVVDFVKMPTFAQLLREVGYRTSVTGKWQLATLEIHPDHPRIAGFDAWCLWQIWKTNPSTGVGEKTTRYWNPTYNKNGDLMDDISHSFGPDVLVDFVIEQMTEATEAGEPFLIVHNELMPHFPMVQTPDDLAAVPQRPATLANMVQYMDKLVRRLLSAVEDLGIRDNTYVVFMADNGTDEPYFKNPLADQPGELAHTRHTQAGPVNGGKHTVTDGGTHVPLIIWGPDDVPQGEVKHALVDVVDLYPTFCDIAGVSIPKSYRLDGYSLLPLLHGKLREAREFVHGSSGRLGAVFDGRWRLKKSGELIDAKDLPIERPADEDTSEAQNARVRLEGIMSTLK